MSNNQIRQVVIKTFRQHLANMCGVNYKAVKAVIKIEDMPSLKLISAHRIKGFFTIKVANSLYWLDSV